MNTKDLPPAPPPSAYEAPTYFAQEPPTQQVNKITKMAKIHLLLGLLLIEPHLRNLDEQKLSTPSSYFAKLQT